MKEVDPVPGSSMLIFTVSLLQLVLSWRAETGPYLENKNQVRTALLVSGEQWAASERQMGEVELGLRMTKNG